MSIFGCSYVCTIGRYCIAGNFRGRKLSQISRFCGYLRKFSPQIWGHGIFGAAKASNSRKFFPRKSYFHQSAKVFSLESFSTIQYKAPLSTHCFGQGLDHQMVLQLTKWCKIICRVILVIFATAE